MEKKIKWCHSTFSIICWYQWKNLKIQIFSHDKSSLKPRNEVVVIVIIDDVLRFTNTFSNTRLNWCLTGNLLKLFKILKKIIQHIISITTAGENKMLK